MIQDPIIQEVRAIRDEIARVHDYDIDAIFEALRKAEASSAREHVTLKPLRQTMLRVFAEQMLVTSLSLICAPKNC